MSDLIAYTGARIFDGETWRDNAALIVVGERIHNIGAVPEKTQRVELNGGYLVPGYVDLQVNGGGGHLVGPGTGVADLRLVADMHARFGVTSLLPTLISDSDDVLDAVLAAAVAAVRQRVPGLLGLHLEGPHLSQARRGAHDPALIRPMSEADLVRIERARAELPHLLVTVAAETVSPEQIARLAKAGIVVSLGHSDASFEQASSAIRAGARMATHLFNAMSPLGHREPGVVGAALHHGEVWAGIIADGIHVHPATLAAALRAKRDPGKIFLVSDSMSQAGTDVRSFELNGRTIHRQNGALRLGDGTLAGADLTLDGAVRYVHQQLGLDLGKAIGMATSGPARAIGDVLVGELKPGSPASFAHLDSNLTVVRAWRQGASAACPAG